MKFSGTGFPRTVILRNLPNNCSKRKLLDEVSEAGFAGWFDSFHMPLDQDTGANKGYAFFSFKTSSTAEIFRSAFHGKRLPGFKSKKVLVVELARVQSSAQEQCTSVIKEQHKLKLNPSLIPAKVSLSTLSAIPLHLDKFERQSKLIASSPAKVVISKLASEKLVVDSSQRFFSDGERDDEGHTPSISDVDSASDDESKPISMMQIQPEMLVFMYSVSL